MRTASLSLFCAMNNSGVPVYPTLHTPTIEKAWTCMAAETNIPVSYGNLGLRMAGHSGCLLAAADAKALAAELAFVD